MHVSMSTYIRTNQTNAKTVESGSSRNNLYYLFIISINLPVIALVGLYCKQKRQRTHLKRMRMQETCQSNAGVYRRTTIPLEIVSVASVSSFESSVSSECMYFYRKLVEYHIFSRFRMFCALLGQDIIR